MRKSDFPVAVLRRKAVVYVRQSTMAQVEDNAESRRRQYALGDLARDCGFRRVDVIDDDLGRSAGGTTERPGFERLVAMLCAGDIGAVFCSEASRLARNGRDWHHLLELCGLVGARVVDGEEVYDPCRPDDRLLLGMKGSISEFELGVLRNRMTEALWSKAERGELRIQVPIGYVWEPDGVPALDPDRRVQEVIRVVFDKFRELGSARQVLLWLTREELHLPRPEDGRRMTGFAWRPARYRGVISLLKNPFHAGAYAYGKTKPRTEMVDGRARKSYGHDVPMQEWRVLIKEHHEGYITWEDYERNQEQLTRNAFGNAAGAPKSGRGGKALLSGLLRCRRCGHILSVVYYGRSSTPKYRCRQIRDPHGDGRCISFAGWSVDQAVTDELLRVLEPMAMEAAAMAERQMAAEREEARRLRELEIEQARYEARLSERRYAAVDPDNRLVASQLEARWEECMRRVAALERRLSEEDGDEAAEVPAIDLRGLASDLETAWTAPETTMRTRQRLVRTLIEEIVVDVDGERREVVLTIHWKGGRHSEVRARKPGTGEHRRRAPEEAVEIIRTMAGRWPDEQIAAGLNRMATAPGKTTRGPPPAYGGFGRNEASAPIDRPTGTAPGSR